MALKKRAALLISAVGMLALILDGKTALLGAAEGVDLCIRVLIPSLFPFLFFSAMLTGSLWGSSLPVLAPVTRLLGIPAGGECLLIPGFLGGYPAGARQIAQCYESGCLDKATAEHLLSFCSNAGPAFLFGILGSRFSSPAAVWQLWAIHVLSALMTGCLFRPPLKGRISLEPKSASPSRALTGSLRTMAILCGWVILFRILLAFLDRWVLWAFPEAARCLVWGLLELSNGCCSLDLVEEETLRFLLCTVLLSCGGLCIVMQTASVIGDLSLKPYLRGKALQTVFALSLSVLLITNFPWGMVLLPAMVLLPGFLKKRGSIPALSDV